MPACTLLLNHDRNQNKDACQPACIPATNRAPARVHDAGLNAVDIGLGALIVAASRLGAEQASQHRLTTYGGYRNGRCGTGDLVNS